MSVRAFELVPIIDRLVQGKKSKTQISVVECWETCLWIGTTDGFIVYYLLEPGESPTGKLTYRCGLQNQQHLGTQKPVEKIQVMPWHRKLAVLVDGRLMLLQMDTLNLVEDFKIMKTVLGFCRNETHNLGSTDRFELTILRKKGLYNYEMAGNVLGPYKGGGLRDLEDPDFKDISAMARDRCWLCIAQRGQYAMIDLRTGSRLDLFPYDPHHALPIIKRVGASEFLLSVWAEGLTMGMFVTAAGNTSRPPLQWVEPPHQLGYRFPYVLGLCGQSGMVLVTVHSVLDQMVKQSVSFEEGHEITDTNAQLYVSSPNSVALLANVSFDTQIGELLDEKPPRVAEALALADVTYGKNDGELDAEEFERQRKKLLSVQRRAGFAYLSMGKVSDGLDLLAASNTDPREVLVLFPGLLPASSSYDKLTHSDHGLSDITSLVSGERELRAAYASLAKFLFVMRDGHIPRQWRPDIDTSLAQVLAAVDADKLLKLVMGSNLISVDDVVDKLQSHNRYHALATLYFQHGAHRPALDTWRRLTKGEVQDKQFPGVGVVVDRLKQITDTELIYLHAPWVVEKDPAAVAIFTRKHEGQELFKSDEVLEFLRPYGDARMAYLEFLVFEADSKNERFHTQLALFYLDQVMRRKLEVENKRQTVGTADETAYETARCKLRTMLQTSSLYRVDLLLDRVKESDLHAECAILYGKMGQHDRALNLLVHRLRDHTAAEAYCAENTKHMDRQTTQQIYLTLLRVYLAPSADAADSADYTQYAIGLLNSHLADLNLVEVLKLVPENWGMGVLDQFLRRSIRTNLHDHRTKQIWKSLARQDNLVTKHEFYSKTQRALAITEDTRCHKCARPLGESAFAWFPNGTIVHKSCCKNPRVCPVSGKGFD
eukprot:m.464125 g.464125  ORF g.464125 m.464125 type:complete len:883 (-) comp20356_c0_seq1:85-2733(-)